MPSTPFLTDLDSRAEVRGSVDPLGAMAIWTRLGRRVVGNLTTVSSSVRDFKTLVLGFGLVEDVRRRNGPDIETDELAVFLRWEQLAAYTRGRFNGDFAFRGVRRVQRQLSEGSVVPISAQSDCQILGNQKTYGLWGLFTVPARASALLEEEASALTVLAEDYLGRTWRRELAPTWTRLIDQVRSDTRRFNLDKPGVDLNRLRAVWRKQLAGEVAFWTTHIVEGGPLDKTAGRQALLARLLREHATKSPELILTQDTVRGLAAKARRHDGSLSEYLLDIAACDSVLAPAAVLYGFLQSFDGRAMTAAVAAVRKAWPARLKLVDRDRFVALAPELAKANESQGATREWVQLADDLAAGCYEDVLPRLLTINGLVMQSRRGAPWVADENGTLRVKYRDGAGDLPPREALGDLWRFPYFLESLHRVVRELEAA
jgi:hypothetical protein